MKANKGKIVNLGSRDLLIGGKTFATCENISVEVADATDEELEALRRAPSMILRPALSVRLGSK